MEVHPAFRLDFRGDTASVFYRDMLAFIRQWEGDTPTILCMSSGSTGAPKPITLEKVRMVESARMTCRFFGLYEGTKALLCLSPGYIAGKMMLVRAMIHGWHLVAVEPSSLPFEKLEGEKIDFAALVPMQLAGSLGALDRVGKILLGGGEVPALVLGRMTAGTAGEIWHSYAMTETITHVAMRQLYPQMQERFTAMEGIRFSVDGDSCLVVDAPALCAQRLVTRDVVYLADEKSFRYVGRIDGVINSGGIKIFPEQTEKILSEVLDVRFFVAGLPDDKLGQRQVLIVEGSPDRWQDVLQEFMESHIEKHHRPRQVFFLERFALTHTGKIDKKLAIGMIIC